MTATEYRQALDSLPFGKRLPGAVYLIDPGNDLRIPAVLRITVSELRKRMEIGVEFNLLKFHTATPKISFLSYPEFDKDPHPTLMEAVIVDLVTGIRPAGVDELVKSQPHQDIAQGRRVERAGIEDDNGGTHAASVSQVESLAFRCEFVQCGEPCGVLAFQVGEHVLDEGPAVGTHPAAWNPPFIEQPGGEGPGHSQQIRRFPWRNLFLATQNRDGAACGKVLHQFGDEPQREGRQ